MFRKLMYVVFSFIVLSAASGVVRADLAAWDAAISDAGPLHWYKFDETSTNCIDSGSAGMNGVYEDVTLGQAGLFEPATAVGFGRSGANRVSFAGATDLPGPWTAEYIVKTTKAPAGSDAQCLNDSATTSIRLAGWTSVGEAGFTLYGVADYQFTPVAGLTLNDFVIQQNVWVHLVWRNNGSGTQLFLNGELVGTTADMIDLPQLTIGGRSASTSDQFQGVLDEAVVFDRALTDDEIFAHASTTFPVKATNPDPEDGALHADTWVSLGWTAGYTAISHDVYLGDNFDDVNNGTGDTFRGNQTMLYAVAGFPGYPYPDGLVPGTTYYWRIDEVEADGTTKHKGDVWSFLVPPKTGYNPSPANGAEYLGLDTKLSWTAGFLAKLHTVYFGDNFDDVNNATVGLAQVATTYNPGQLEKDKTYYWRIDEFDGSTTHKGNVWSFSTIPTIAVTDPTLIGWWKLDENQGTIALDWSGHDNNGNLAGGPQWVAGQFESALAFEASRVTIPASDTLTADMFQDSFTVAAWINPTRTGNTWQQIFRAVRTDAASDDTLFINNDGTLSWRGRVGGAWAGGMCETVPDAAPANQWAHVAVVGDGTSFRIYVNGALSQESPYQKTDGSNATYYLGGDPTSTGESYSGMIDDVRIYNKALTVEEIIKAMRGDPLISWGPSPANGSTIDLDQALPLSWSPGDMASQHDVYFSTDRDAVTNADTSTADVYRGRQNGTSYNPPEGVEWGGGPYYWRIDEYNTDGSISKGRIWSFTVADYLLVDDFESYNSGENQIWYSWHDGLGYGAPGTANYYAGNGTGSAVGDETTNSYTEETIVHGGNHSMPLVYDNNKQGYAKYSEVEFTLTDLRDWTKDGVAELSLWFRGYPGSVGSFVEGPVGTYTMVGSGADIWDNTGIGTGYHDEFHFAYKMLSGAGSITAKVNSVENTNGWAKAGVMIRETLDADSTHAMTVVTPTQGISFQRRNATAGTSAADTTAGLAAPYWVKITRDLSGNFTASYSANGTAWQTLGAPDNISMTSNVYIGLAVTSHDAALACQAVFSNVTTTGNVTGQWAHQDIGIFSNAAEPLYVALSNSNGTSAVVTNDDPAATQIDTWTEWVIPLSAFADQGVNLTNVDSIAIGLGTRGNMTVPGGSGKMYFDDIRLYRPAEAAEQ
jgi:hypothetical protein